MICDLSGLELVSSIIGSMLYSQIHIHIPSMYVIVNGAWPDQPSHRASCHVICQLGPMGCVLYCICWVQCAGRAGCRRSVTGHGHTVELERAADETK